MIKVCLLSLMLAVGLTSVASAEVASPNPRFNRLHPHQKIDRVTANGRCNGISYGTGARRCGTASGGPVGGISAGN